MNKAQQALFIYTYSVKCDKCEKVIAYAIQEVKTGIVCRESILAKLGDTKK